MFPPVPFSKCCYNKFWVKDVSSVGSIVYAIASLDHFLTLFLMLFSKPLSIWTRVVYRVGQFWQGMRATVTPEDYKRVAAVLPASALSLFTAMPVDAQRHSLNVLDSLWGAGQHHPDLAVAALLHDCGKVAAAQGGVELGLWLRGPLVLLEKFSPSLGAGWAAPNPTQGWRYALYVQREHPAIGAQWAMEPGCSALSCWLIAHHQVSLAGITGTNEQRALLMALQHADEAN